MQEPPISVTVVGGYLGAGKTTLVNHLLRTAGEPIGVLVNDFGEINIDAELIEATDGDTITLANGCICCSLVDGFAVALDTVTSSPTQPTRLLIEASGVADPATVAAWAHRPGLRLDATLVLVDLETIRDQLANEYVGDTVAQQVAAADLIIGNKRDLVGDDELQRVRDAIEPVSSAPLVVVSHGALDPGLAFQHHADTGSATTPSAAIRADERFETWNRSWDAPVSRAEFDALIDDLSPASVRVKGVLRFADDPDTRVIAQRVGRRMTLTPDGVWLGGPSVLVGIDLRTRVVRE